MLERRRKIDEGKIVSPRSFSLSQAPLSLAAHDLTRSPLSERLEQAKKTEEKHTSQVTYQK